MKFSLPWKAVINCFLFIPFLTQAQTTNVYTGSATWNVPAGVSSVSIKVYGGGGGTGGQDCGAGCSNPAAGAVGYVVAAFSVTPGDVIGIYPGGKGVNGSNNVTNTGGGNGGVSTYNVSYNGGKGGNAGPSGASGGGGGGGAASVVTINSTIKIVAGGAGGGGGMANAAGSGYAGSSATSANGTSNTGGGGTTPSGDGGGGGGGGGGQYGSVGGGLHAAGGESAGNGGFRGSNSISGASSITSNTSTAWTSAGQIEITYTSTLPVTWLGFTGRQLNSTIQLNWSTASEQNAWDYVVEHSTDGINWNRIAIKTAAGNATTVQQYNCLHQNPINGTNYYRVMQRDINGRKNFSNVLTIAFAGKARLFSIHPNPAVNGVLSINLREAAVIRLYNSVGEQVIQKQLSAGLNTINLSALPKGYYYVKAGREAAAIHIQ